MAKCIVFTETDIFLKWSSLDKILRNKFNYNMLQNTMYDLVNIYSVFLCTSYGVPNYDAQISIHDGKYRQ